MKETVERELKLHAGEGFELPDLGGEPLDSRVFVSTYHDTPDFRLVRAGVTLRHRVENGRGLWQLKLPRGAARLELEVQGGPREAPSEMVELLPALTRGRELAPVARLRTRRGGVLVRANGRPGAEVTFDRVSVLDGQRVVRRFDELEAELVGGDEKLLAGIERALLEAGAVSGAGRPKLVQALELEGDEPAGDPTSTVAALRTMFRRQLGALLVHDPGTRRGDDPEDLHQLRVATRRTRAFLRAARPVLAPEWAGTLRDELRWLGGVAGPVRDLDVLLEHLQADVAELDERDRKGLSGLFTRLEEERAADRELLVEALRSDRYYGLLDRLEDAAEAPRVVDDGHSLQSLWAREWKRLRRAARTVSDDAADEELHALRIRVKRARYAAELAEPAMGKHARSFVAAAKVLQDVLGDHQDAVVAEARIRAWLRGTRSTVSHFAAGRLVERQRARRREARAGWRHAWKELERAGRRARRSGGAAASGSQPRQR